MTTLGPSFLKGSSFFQVTSTTVRSRMSSKFSNIRPGTAEFAALEVWKNPHRLNYNGRNVVITLAPSFLNGSSFLQAMRITIKNFELAALERLKNSCIML